MPTRALSRCCDMACRGGSIDAAMTTSSGKMAGECGNRTHPTLRCKVTVILKITEATRLHPPPLSLNFDRNFSPVDDLADDCRPRDPRKIVSGLVATDADGKSTGCLWIVEDGSVF